MKETTTDGNAGVPLAGGIAELGARFTTAYAKLSKATRAFYLDSQIEITARSNYAEAKATLLLSYAENPKELGANEAARESTVKLRLFEESLTLEAAAELVAKSRCELSIAQIEVDHLRAQLRCLEVIAQFGGEKGGL